MASGFPIGASQATLQSMATLRGTVDEGEACGLGTNVSLHEATLAPAVSSSAAAGWPRSPFRSQKATLASSDQNATIRRGSRPFA
jgi:hypothetical protein